MDPNADDAIELHELEDTFVRAMQTPEADALEKSVTAGVALRCVCLIQSNAQVGKLIRQLEKEMAVKQLKMTDLLRELDADGNGSVSASELEHG